MNWKSLKVDYEISAYVDNAWYPGKVEKIDNDLGAYIHFYGYKDHRYIKKDFKILDGKSLLLRESLLEILMAHEFGEEFHWNPPELRIHETCA